MGAHDVGEGREDQGLAPIAGADLEGTPIETEVVGLEHLRAGYKRLTRYAADCGFRIQPTCRVAMYGRALDRTFARDRRDDDPVNAHTAAFELRQLVTIVDGLGELAALRTVFRRLLEGPYGTLFSRVRDQGRDVQFELFVAAKLALGGLTVSLEEPDIAVQVAGQRIPIAAKRPRSPRGIKSALRGGCHQVARAGAKGFVAVDASMYPIPGQLLVALVDGAGDVPRTTAAQLHQVIRSNESVLHAALRYEPEKTGTLGVLFHMAVPFSVDLETKLQFLVGEAWTLVLARRELLREARPILAALGAASRAARS